MSYQNESGCDPLIGLWVRFSVGCSFTAQDLASPKVRVETRFALLFNTFSYMVVSGGLDHPYSPGNSL